MLPVEINRALQHINLARAHLHNIKDQSSKPEIEFALEEARALILEYSDKLKFENAVQEEVEKRMANVTKG